MQEYIQYLKDNFNEVNVIFIDFMDLSFENLKEYHALHVYVEERYEEGKANYLFIDEVQMCPNFELAVNSLYSKRNTISISLVPMLFCLVLILPLFLLDVILKYTSTHSVLKSIANIMKTQMI